MTPSATLTERIDRLGNDVPHAVFDRATAAMITCGVAMVAFALSGPLYASGVSNGAMFIGWSGVLVLGTAVTLFLRAPRVRRAKRELVAYYTEDLRWLSEHVGDNLVIAALDARSDWGDVVANLVLPIRHWRAAAAIDGIDTALLGVAMRDALVAGTYQEMGRVFLSVWDDTHDTWGDNRAATPAALNAMAARHETQPSIFRRELRRQLVAA
jgi:hypothetical protein